MSQPDPHPSPSAGPSAQGIDRTSPAMGGEQPTRTPSRMSLSALVNSPPAHTLASISGSQAIPSTSQDRSTLPGHGGIDRYPSPTRSNRSVDPSLPSSHSRTSATPSRRSPHPLPLSAQSHASHSRISPSYASPRGFPHAPQYVSPVDPIEARHLEGYRDEYGQIRHISQLDRGHGRHDDMRVDPYAPLYSTGRGIDHHDRQRERYSHSRGRSSPTKVHPPPLDPSYYPNGAIPSLNGAPQHVAESSRNVRRMMPSLALAGSEEIWEGTLASYQAQREAEVDGVVLIQQQNPNGLSPIKRDSQRKEEYGPSSVNGDSLLEDLKAKRKVSRKRPVKNEATVEDELLGLVDAGSSLPPSDAIEPDDDLGPDTIVQPSGLTRAQLIAKVEANDLSGLTEQDVKAVQDEVWERQINRQGARAPTKKDGSLRRKPGPAKGWKKLRTGETLTEGYAEQVADRRGSSIRDADSEFGDYGSVMDDEMNGEADAEIAALLAGHGSRKGKGRAKRRRDDDGMEERYAEYSDDGYDYDGYPDDRRRDLDDDILSMADDPYGRKKGSRKSLGGARPRVRARPSQGDIRQAEDELLGLAMGPNEYEGGRYHQDPRGVSEVEARTRHNLVEELQKQVWQVIIRDIPRVYRVYQAHDSAVKTDCSRTAQACMRNAFSQRAMKPTFKSVARINKDTISKSRRVVKEMLLYWRKNEKDELAARKKAEKEALDRAKAEEEARESKRQARKLNFLLTQTELYSHFIGKKIKTAEAEGGDGEVTPAREGEEDRMVERDELLAKGEIGLDANGEPLADLDYDDDDDEALRRHAARGAHAAVQAAREKAKAFDEARGGQPVLDLDGDELNFQNPTLAEDSVTITQPKMLMAQLKEYQLKGLTWLGNLYEQGINGILADEMGLGKTIQSISLLAYLAEHHNLWGPFLVIAPASTLHNWQQELARFVPRLKALPYWGSPKDRETLRKIWSRKNMTFTEDSPFHVLVTSYQLAVQDEKYFHATRWQYMILDEAQAIKSSSSARWKSLLSLHCRNRLLLTGTPIQNSMQELWALLHFIMPSLFDSHEEFSEWFSKDIENAAGGGSGTLQPEQLRRLHMILKPFMLRRVKKHVQKELGDKIEIDLLVDLSQRQRSIYKALRQRVSIADLIAQANNLTDSMGAKNLMNLVMQFRKVCNHPDLFERADVVSPYVFGTFSHSGPFSREGDQMYCPDSLRNLIDVKLPKLIWTDGGKLDRPMESGIGADTRYVHGLMNIWNTDWINKEDKDDAGQFGFLKLLDMSPWQAATRAKSHPLVDLLHRAEEDAEIEETGYLENDLTFAASTRHSFAHIPPSVPSTPLRSGLTALTDITNQSWHDSFLSRREARFAIQPAVTTYIKPVISDRSYLNTEARVFSDPVITKALYGPTPSERKDPRASRQLAQVVPGVTTHGLITDSLGQTPWSTLQIPPPKRLIVDSAKLARLDDLLRELKAQGHRVLLYFQMTKMMDLVEEYLVYRQYRYLRLDGSSPIGERRDMVTNFQTNPDYFIFCLSTRAGGLGINLTAADTVIFYDHDWNPSNDAQAMDRAHRVGQTKQVTVYRLIARGTIEERILKLARAKKDVQDIVVGTKSLTDVAKPSEIVSLFMDDEELAESVAKRKQAEAHGYVAPTSIAPKPKSQFGDALGGMDDDEDDFFSLKKRPANGEDEDFGDEGPPGAGANGVNGGTKKSKKRKADGDTPKKAVKKKVKIALGPDGLPL